MDDCLSVRTIVEELIVMRDRLDNYGDKQLLADACNALDRYAIVLLKKEGLKHDNIL